MAPYEQSLFAVKLLFRISIYEKMLTENFADRSQFQVLPRYTFVFDPEI